MKVHLVHHADAVLPDVDPQRPLSALGLVQAAGLAEAAHQAGVRPGTIWHSGKLRARQTAEAFLRTCNPFATFLMVRGLRPDDSPEWMRDALEGESEDADVLLCGHMPHLDRLAALLGASGTMPVHGLVSLARTAPRRYQELRRISSPNNAAGSRGG